MFKGLFFGSIGVVAETSELQRRAFNQAFKEAGMTWCWNEDMYKLMLVINGGQKRIRHYAKNEGASLSETEVANLHSRKTEIYNGMLAAGDLEARPGVKALIKEAKTAGLKLAWTSTTSRQNVEAVASATGLSLDDFDEVFSAERVQHSKPDPEVYTKALDALGLSPEEAVAVEDTASSLQAALNAGLTTVVTPGAYTKDQDVSGAAMVIDNLGDLDGLQTLRDLVARGQTVTG